MEAARSREEEARKAASEAGADAPAGPAPALDAVHKESPSPFPEEGMEKVRAFLKARSFGKEEPRIRAVLAEFVRFCAGQP